MMSTLETPDFGCWR